MVQTRRQQVACLLPRYYEALDVVLFAAALSRAGEQWNHKAFELTLYASPGVNESGQPLALNPCSFEHELSAQIVFVPSAARPAPPSANASDIARALAELSSTAACFCAVGNGQLHLARAGLLSQACVAPALAEAVAELCPAITIDTASPWRSSDNLLLGATSLSALDLALELIQRYLGRGEKRRIAIALGQMRAGLQLTIT